MDAARKWRGRQTRESMPSIPALDSMWFKQKLYEIMPDQYDGFHGPPDYFVVDSQWYFSSLCDPKPTESQFIRFMMSRFFGSARTWAQRIAATRPWVLEDSRQFSVLFLKEFEDPGQNYDLDKVLEGHGKLPFHVYYEQVRRTVTTQVPATSQTHVPATSQTHVPAISQTHVPATSQDQVTVTSQDQVTVTPPGQAAVSNYKAQVKSHVSSPSQVQPTSQVQVQATSLVLVPTQAIPQVPGTVNQSSYVTVTEEGSSVESQLQATQVLLQEETLHKWVPSIRLCQLEDERNRLRELLEEEKMFLVSLAFVYFAKALQGSYMKSSVTQIERRFDIASSQIGFIDGSFEMGNLLVIAFVSYFGAKLHRPRLIGVGCLIMAVGSFITALPHFLQGPYKYETTITHVTESSETESIFPCLANGSHSQEDESRTAESQTECEKTSGSYLWIYVFLGNMLRGIGETPVMPLGLSYMDDFAREENIAFYIACIQSFGILGPVVGFMLGSFCAKLYVDIGAVNLDSISINHKDSRWVGAWWLGFLASGAVMLLAGIPFWFLPRSLPKQVEGNARESQDVHQSEQDSFIPVVSKNSPPSEKAEPVNMVAMAKDFLPSLRRLFSNTVYVLIICTGMVQVSSFIGMITFKPKYMEQIYGQSPSKGILLIGIMNVPALALGIILGGFVMKKFQLSVLGAAKMTISTTFLAFVLMLSQYFLHCGNTQVAGLTVNYQGFPDISSQQESLLSQCNSGCACSLKHWDPVCAFNGLTYSTPCLAGCQSSTGFGKEMVFHNCSCIPEAPVPSLNMSAVLGQCPRKDNCDYMFKIYMVVTVIGAFISASGATPAYIVLLRSIQPELKSLALGMQMLIVRTLGGIPPPIYFGALIDRTCLKWGTKRCGGQGACRLYNADTFRMTFLGLIYGLSSLAFLLWMLLFNRISHRQRQLALQNQANSTEPEGNNIAIDNGNAPLAFVKCKEELDKETSI